jgi:hypothetical protein
MRDRRLSIRREATGRPHGRRIVVAWAFVLTDKLESIVQKRSFTGSAPGGPVFHQTVVSMDAG